MEGGATTHNGAPSIWAKREFNTGDVSSPKALRWVKLLPFNPNSTEQIKQCEKLVPRFLRAVHQLRQAGLAQLVALGDTLYTWREEIASMWRFTRNNGITEGFHNKMELISRQAYGFRNFENYRIRVKVLCS